MQTNLLFPEVSEAEQVFKNFKREITNALSEGMRLFYFKEAGLGLEHREASRQG